MFLLWLRLVITFCLFRQTLTEKGSNIEWRHFGGSINIKCRYSKSGKTSLSLMKGLNEEQKVLYQQKSGNPTIASAFTDRLNSTGVFPNLDLYIINLTTEDTGPYWCIYSEFDKEAMDTITAKGDGSVLLVVTDNRPCKPPKESLILVAVVILVAVLFIIIMTCLICIFLKARHMRGAAKERSVPVNDVYEEMRGTIRR